MVDDLECIPDLVYGAWRDGRWPLGQLWGWVIAAIRTDVLPCTPGGKISRAAFERLVAEKSHHAGGKPGRRGRVRDLILAARPFGPRPGESYKAIARELGCSEKSVRNVFNPKK